MEAVAAVMTALTPAGRDGELNHARRDDVKFFLQLLFAEEASTADGRVLLATACMRSYMRLVYSEATRKELGLSPSEEDRRFVFSILRRHAGDYEPSAALFAGVEKLKAVAAELNEEWPREVLVEVYDGAGGEHARAARALKDKGRSRRDEARKAEYRQNREAMQKQKLEMAQA